jgi:uncharacterized C2H2 Zn-finger protein
MGMFLYECPVCGFISRNRNSMINHIKRHNKNLKLSDCKRISKKTYEYIETKVEDDD